MVHPFTIQRPRAGRAWLPCLAALLLTSSAAGQAPARREPPGQLRPQPSAIYATSVTDEGGLPLNRLESPLVEAPSINVNVMSDNLIAWDPHSTTCCGDCPPGWIVRADLLFLNREGESGTTLSTGFALGDFNYEEAGRIQAIWRRDCLDAWELAWLGPYEFNLYNQAVGPGLNATFSSPTLNLSAFNNAVYQRQDYRSQLISAEANRRCFGWDVINFSVGVRYLNIDEDLSFYSVNDQNAEGLLTVETNNHLAGVQGGLELSFPVGRWSSVTSARGGLFANFPDGNASIVNAGVPQLMTSDDEVDFSGLVELGQYFTVQITPNVKFRGGYELWWLWGVALAPDQLVGPLTSLSGNNLNNEGDVLYHGATAGVEVTW